MRQTIIGILVISALIAVLLPSASYAQEATPLFAPAPNSPIPVADGAPGTVALGDLNADGKLDLVTANAQEGNLTILFGQGNGRFQAAPNTPIRLNAHPTELILGDVDNNKTLDLVIGDHNSYGLTLLLGEGKGNFELTPTSPIVMKKGGHPHTHGLDSGDFNGDGNLDLVTANQDDDDVAVMLGDGKGGFSSASGSPFAVAPKPYPLVVGDANNDGYLDIVSSSVVRSNGALDDMLKDGRLTVLFGDGKGGFKRTDVSLRTPESWYPAIGDLNGDKRPDLVTTHAERNELSVLLGNGDNTYTEVSGSPFNLGHSAWRVLIVDVNQDSKPDMVTAAGQGVRVMLGDGKGGFQTAPGSPFPVGAGAWRLDIGDINSDGKPDIATSNLESKSVSILLAQ